VKKETEKKSDGKKGYGIDDRGKTRNERKTIRLMDIYGGGGKGEKNSGGKCCIVA